MGETEFRAAARIADGGRHRRDGPERRALFVPWKLAAGGFVFQAFRPPRLFGGDAVTRRADLRVVDDAAPGLDLPANIDHHGWREIGLDLVRKRRAAGMEWRVGDWAARADGSFATLADAAEIVEESHGNLKKYVSCAKAYPKVRRRTQVSFCLHLEAVRLPEAEREKVLDEAEAHAWTRARMREAVLDAKRSGKAQRRPDPEDSRDAAARYKSRLAAERKSVASGIKRMVRIAVEISRSDEIEALHGNARAGLATEVEKQINAISDLVNDMVDKKVGPACARLRGVAR